MRRRKGDNTEENVRVARCDSVSCNEWINHYPIRPLALPWTDKFDFDHVPLKTNICQTTLHPFKNKVFKIVRKRYPTMLVSIVLIKSTVQVLMQKVCPSVHCNISYIQT